MFEKGLKLVIVVGDCWEWVIFVEMDWKKKEGSVIE
jgi:hypothetical protein